MINQLAQRLFANKFLLTAASISAIVFFFVLILSSRRSSTPSPTQDSAISKSTNPFYEFTNLTEEKAKNAANYRTLVSDRFPIYLKGFSTSVGITTTINIYFLKDDDPSMMRLEIYGLSYMNKDELDPNNNPNIVAYKESFTKALSLIRDTGVDPKQLNIIYGDRPEIQETANYWVDKLGLLR